MQVLEDYMNCKKPLQGNRRDRLDNPRKKSNHRIFIRPFIEERELKNTYFDYNDKWVSLIENTENEKQLTVAGNSFTLPIALKSISEQIMESEEILDYDWEEADGEQTDKTTYLKAINFLVEYSTYIYETYGIVLATPYIDIMSDGGVSINWFTPKSEFLIIFKKGDNQNAYYFGIRKDNKIPFKSGIEIGKPIDESLASWMKKNL